MQLLHKCWRTHNLPCAAPVLYVRTRRPIADTLVSSPTSNHQLLLNSNPPYHLDDFIVELSPLILHQDIDSCREQLARVSPGDGCDAVDSCYMK